MSSSFPVNPLPPCVPRIPQGWTAEANTQTSITVSAATDALLVIDMQNDFVDRATGSLYVSGGEGLVASINALSVQLPFRVQVGTQDWHTADHSSFTPQGGPWPVHCIAGTHGAALCDGLEDKGYNFILRKGTTQEVDSNSAFYDAARGTTGLTGLLRAVGVTRVFVVGVALDVCVRASVLDAIADGFHVIVVEDACKAVDTQSQPLPALEVMKAAGAVMAHVKDLI